MESFSKQPSESYTIAVEFSGKLPTGASLSSGTCAAYDPNGASVSATVLTGVTVSVSGTQARIGVQNGTHGVDYRLRFLMTLTTNEVLEEDILMRVENK